MRRGCRFAVAALAGVAGAAGVCTQASAGTGTVHDARLLSLTAPRDDKLVTDGRLRIRFRAAPGTTSIRIYVGGRRVRPALERRGRRYSAVLSVRRLRPGPHQVLITSRAGRRRDRDATTFYVGRRRASLVALRTSGLAVRLRLRRSPRRLAIRLNGRDATRALWPLRGRVRSGRLSPGEGLRFGRNVLVVRALLANGVYDVERRVFRVARRRPLASAGPNRIRTVRSRVRLSGRRSLATRRGRKLGYSWKLVRAPRGSKTRVRTTRDLRPVIRPDRPGRYVVRLTVRERRRGAASAAAAGSSDTMVLDAAPRVPAIGWQINTLASRGGQTGISYGPHFVPNQGPSGSLQILVLDKTDLTTSQTPATPYYDLSSSAGVTALANDLKSLEESPLVVLAGGASINADTLDAVNDALAQIGVAALPQGTDGAFSAIGVPGAAKNSMYLNPGGSLSGFGGGALTGYLSRTFAPNQPPSQTQPVPPATPGFGFTYGSYEKFQLSSSGSTATITLGPQTFNLTASGNSGGALAVVVVDGQTLQPFGSPQEPGTLVYYVNAPGEEGLSEQQRLAKVLDDYDDRPGALVAVQAIGTVTGPFAGPDKGTNPGWSSISASLGKFGATQHLVNTIDGGYSLVGGTSFTGPAAETSTSQSGRSSAQLQGIFSLNNTSSSFEPVVHDALAPGQGFYYDLLPLAYGPTTKWPNEGQSEYDAAYKWISRQLKVPDLRATYVAHADDPAVWSDAYDSLTNKIYKACPADNPNFSQAVCQAQVKELEREVQWVPAVDAYIDALQKPLLISGTSSYADLQATFAEVQQSVAANAQDNTASTLLDVISEGFDLMSYLAGDDLEPAIGGLGALIGLASPLVENPDGSPVLSQLQTQVAQLGVQLEDSYADTLVAYEQIEAIILTDYGKLSTAGQGIGGPGIGPGQPGWRLGTNTLSDAVDMLEDSATRWSFGELMPLAWPQVILPSGSEGTTVDNPYDWPCYVGGGNPSHPFQSTPGDGTGWFLAYVASGSPPVVGPQMWILGSADPSSSSGPEFTSPKQSLTDAMNQSFDGNLLLRAQFWAREFNPVPLEQSFIDACSN